jgi:threonine/homoserine/homoserine lactone efflux protein
LTGAGICAGIILSMSADHWATIMTVAIPAVTSLGVAYLAYLGRGGHDDDSD